MKKLILTIVAVAVSGSIAEASKGKIIGQVIKMETNAALRMDAEALKVAFTTAKTETRQELDQYLKNYIEKNGKMPQMALKEKTIFDKELSTGEFFELKVQTRLSPTGKVLSDLVFITDTNNAKVLKDVSDIFSVELSRWKSLNDFSSTTLLLTDESSEAVLKQVEILARKINSDTIGSPSAQLTRKSIRPKTDK